MRDQNQPQRRRRTLCAVIGTLAIATWAITGGHPLSAAPAAKQAAGWSDVPPMPRYKPMIFESGKLPKGLGPKTTSQARPKATYKPQPPASSGKLSLLPPGLPNAKENGLASRIQRHYGTIGRSSRLLVETDKPIYKPGEVIWLRAAEYLLRGAKGQASNRPLAGTYTLQSTLYNPRGAKFKRANIRLQQGHAMGQFVLPRNVVGGAYKLVLRNTITGAQVTKELIVNQYQPPRIKKKLEFLRKGYGAGDEVEATVTLRRATGPVLANHRLRLVARLAGKSIKQWRARTNAKGMALLRFRLPKKLTTDDGALTVMITDAGVTESISRPIPLAIKQIKVGFFPEGGAAIVGLPARIYVAARRTIDQKPIDLAGEIKDNSGHTVATFRSFHDGMGRFRFTPQAGKRYALHITQPKGIDQAFSLPQAKADGVALQMLDDFRSQKPKLRFVLSSRKPQRVSVTALQHEQLIAHKAVQLKEGRQVVALPLRFQARGIVRLTVWSDQLQPLAERLVFRHRDKGLKISIKPDRKGYEPRGTAQLRLQVKDAAGKPMRRAVIGVRVVDDTVLSYADDQSPHWLAQRFLSSQLTGKLHKPNFYFDKKKPKAWRGLDLIMGTHGWRGFSWQQVREGEPPKRRIDAATWRTYNYQHFQRAYKRAYSAIMYKKKTTAPLPKLLTKDDIRALLAKKGKERQKLIARQTATIVTKPAKAKKKVRVRANDRFGVKQKPRDARDKARLVKKEQKRVLAKVDANKQQGPRERREKNQGAKRGKKLQKQMKQKVVLAGKDRVAKNEPSPAPVVAAAKKRAQLDDDAGDVAPQAAPMRAKRDIRAVGRAFRAPPMMIQRRRQRRHQLRMRNADGLLGAARRKRLARLRRKRRMRYVHWRRWYRQYYKRYRKITTASRVAYVRRFPTRFYHRRLRQLNRTDFRDTVYWNPRLYTDDSGNAVVRFGLNDSITSFRVNVSGWGAGQLGMADHVITSKRPFFMVAKAPIAVSADDAMALPLTLRNDTRRQLSLLVRARVSSTLKLLENPLPSRITLKPGEARTYFYPVRAVAKRGQGSVRFTASAEGISDDFTQRLQIQPRGFPRNKHLSGQLDGSTPIAMEIALPKDVARAAPDGEIMLIPAPSTSLLKGLEGMLRMPSGCFEQTSSSNYPNVMILRYLKSRKKNRPLIQQRAISYLRRGYQRLTGYETKIKGFEWFGRAPGHEALTAYGLMQFVQMKKVYPKVSASMIDRTRKWLLDKRDGKGGYSRSSRALDSFGRAPADITNAYITYALTEAGTEKLAKELQQLERLGRKSNDPYLLALALNGMINSKRTNAAKVIRKRLLSQQGQDGGFRGKRSSITRSGGRNLHIETTSLAVLGLLKTGRDEAAVARAMTWLRKQQRYGRFGSTQATILALQAIIAYEKVARRPKAPGVVKISINGKVIAERAFTAKTEKALAFRKFVRFLRPGKNKIELLLRSKRKLPFSVGLKYFTRKPATSPGTAVAIQTALQQPSARMGENVRLTVTLDNKTNKGLPMVLARVRYPGALAPQLWQLKQLREQKKVAFIETRPRELLLYFRGMAPKAKKVIHFDLTARVTGNYNAAASSAYLYYTDDLKAWASPLQISVKP